MNKVILMGRLTRDVDFKSYGNGDVAHTGLAVNRRFSKDNSADFFNLTAFGKIASVLSRYCRKGSKILVEGRLQTSTYEKDGVKHYATDIIVDNIEFADSNKKENSGGNEFSGKPVDDEDYPF